MHKSPKQFVRDIFSGINRRMHTQGGRNFLLYMVCFCVAFLFWCIMTLNDTTEHDYDVEVELVNMPDSIILVGDMPHSLNVVLRGKGTQFVRYYFMKVPTLQLDFRQYSSRSNNVALSRLKLDSKLRDLFGQGVAVVSVNPDSIRVPYTSTRGFRLPLKVNARIKAASSSAISGPIMASLDSVTVYTINGQRPEMDYVETELLERSDIADTMVCSLPLKKIQGARIIPDVVDVTVPAELLASRKSMLPVTVVNEPEGVSVITYPAAIEVSYLVPLRLSGIDIDAKAVVDYHSINNSSRYAAVDVQVAPGAYRVVSVSKDSVEYVIDR